MKRKLFEHVFIWDEEAKKYMMHPRTLIKHPEGQIVGSNGVTYGFMQHEGRYYGEKR